MAGTTSSAIAFGGAYVGTELDTTQRWNGTTWNTTVSMNVARVEFSYGGANSSNAIAAGGDNGSYLNSTEIFLQADITFGQSGYSGISGYSD